MAYFKQMILPHNFLKSLFSLWSIPPSGQQSQVQLLRGNTGTTQANASDHFSSSPFYAYQSSSTFFAFHHWTGFSQSLRPPSKALLPHWWIVCWVCLRAGGLFILFLPLPSGHWGHWFHPSNTVFSLSSKAVQGNKQIS